jgi:hypothetical protein
LDAKKQKNYDNPTKSPVILEIIIYTSPPPWNLPHRAVPYLQGDVHIATLAPDVVGIEGFGVTALENMALATNLAIMQAFPCIKDIGLTLFLGGVVNLRRLHKLYK